MIKPALCRAQNKAKFQEKRNQQSSDGCIGGGCSCGGQNHQGCGYYGLNKLGVASTAHIDNLTWK